MQTVIVTREKSRSDFLITVLFDGNPVYAAIANNAGIITKEYESNYGAIKPDFFAEYIADTKTAIENNDAEIIERVSGVFYMCAFDVELIMSDVKTAQAKMH